MSNKFVDESVEFVSFSNFEELPVDFEQLYLELIGETFTDPIESILAAQGNKESGEIQILFSDENDNKYQFNFTPSDVTIIPIKENE